MLIAGHERELITYMIKNERSRPDSATADAIESWPPGRSAAAASLDR